MQPSCLKDRGSWLFGGFGGWGDYIVETRHNIRIAREMDAATEAAEYSAKYRIYERDYLRRINHKYFSGKNLAGTGRVFDTVTTVEGFVVKESREPPIKRFLETPNSQEEQSSKSGGTPATKRHMARKSG